MKRFVSIAFASACALYSHVAMAQQDIDTVKVQQIDEVVVKAVRASQNAPFAVTNIKKTDLQAFSRTGKELPFLFARTPGVLAWSENGTGVGNAYVRMRGAAASRINVTLDGVSLNSPEDQSVFWADMGMAGMTVNEDRLESINFSISYATGVQVIIVPEDSEITSYDDLCASSANPHGVITSS